MSKFQEISIADYKNRNRNKLEKEFIENQNAMRYIQSEYEKKVEVNINEKINFTEK